MKLLGDLFEISERFANASGFTATIKLSPGHIIYAGHFPGHPVTPAVVQLQVVHELLEDHFGKKIKLISLDDCKFLKIINPEVRNELQISVEYVLTDPFLDVRATGKCDPGIFLKLKGTYEFI